MFWSICIGVFTLVNGQYQIPELTIELLQPKGFNASIPDEKGIKLFAFDAKLNEVLGRREKGTFSKDVTKPENGKWTFTDESTKLTKDDVLYYRYYVDYFDGRSTLGYVKHDKYFIEDLIDDEEEPENDDYTIFQENFNSDVRSRNIWSLERRYSGEPDFEFNAYLDSLETIEVKNGILRIKPVQSIHYSEALFASTSSYKIENCTATSKWLCERTFGAGYIPPPVISSQISTKHKFSFKYGTIVVRAKLPKGDWLYPEIFLNPLNEEYGDELYKSGQIRIAYVEGNSDTLNQLHGGIILENTVQARSYGIKTMIINGSWSDDFHDFAVKWTPDNITVMVDNITYGVISPPANGFGSLAKELGIETPTWNKGTKMAPFDQKMYITLGVGAGGFNFKDRPEKPWINNNVRAEYRYYQASNKWNKTWSNDSVLEVDYVKVFTYYRNHIPDVSHCDLPSVTVFNGKTACKGLEIFNYSFIDLVKRYWKPEIRFAGMPDYEFVIYTKNEESMYIGNDMLIIKPITTEVVYGKGSIYRPLNLGKKCTGEVRTRDCVVKPEAGFILPVAVSSQVTTKHSFVFKYGTIEIRAKLPKGDWIYPELFLMPVNSNFGPDYDFGQIRIAFVPGNKGFDKTLYGGALLGRDRSTRRLIMKQLEHISSWSDDFHKFSVVWKPDHIALYVDGTSYGKIGLPISSKSPKAAFDKEMYIAIGVGVGGFSFDDDVFPDKPWANGDRLSFKKFYNASSDWLKTWGDSSALEVDYVRVWAL